MQNDVYHRLRERLHEMPNGFPSTESGVEIDLLKKIFTEDEAELFLKLKMSFESLDDIALRTGIEKESLGNKLREMRNKGQLFCIDMGDMTFCRAMPFVFGIFEFQLNRLDREFSDLFDRYYTEAFGRHFHGNSPPLMKVVPVEKEIPSVSVIHPYESASALINTGKSWAVADCICKKERRLLGKGCEHPLETCLAIAPVENAFTDGFWGRPITKDEAFEVLDMAEEAGLVHMTGNVQNGQMYICNCCGCSCAILRGITELGLKGAAARSNYCAVVDEERCTGCGTCVERCQVKAIDLDDIARVNDLCIGCGLCVTTCPTEAMSLQVRDEQEAVPADEMDWWRLRAESRGSDAYKKLL